MSIGAFSLLFPRFFSFFLFPLLPLPSPFAGSLVHSIRSTEDIRHIIFVRCILPPLWKRSGILSTTPVLPFTRYASLYSLNRKIPMIRDKRTAKNKSNHCPLIDLNRQKENKLITNRTNAKWVSERWQQNKNGKRKTHRRSKSVERKMLFGAYFPYSSLFFFFVDFSFLIRIENE